VTTSPIREHVPAERTKKQIWHKESRRRRNHLFQILSKSVKGFSSCDGPKMGIFHWLWPSPLQQVSTTVLPVSLQLSLYFVNTSCQFNRSLFPFVWDHPVANSYFWYQSSIRYVTRQSTWAVKISVRTATEYLLDNKNQQIFIVNRKNEHAYLHRHQCSSFYWENRI